MSTHESEQSFRATTTREQLHGANMLRAELAAWVVDSIVDGSLPDRIRARFHGVFKGAGIGSMLIYHVQIIGRSRMGMRHMLWSITLGILMRL